MERACLARPKARSTAERRSDRLGLTNDESPREHVRRSQLLLASRTGMDSGSEGRNRKLGRKSSRQGEPFHPLSRSGRLPWLKSDATRPVPRVPSQLILHCARRFRALGELLGALRSRCAAAGAGADAVRPAARGGDDLGAYSLSTAQARLIFSTSGPQGPRRRLRGRVPGNTGRRAGGARGARAQEQVQVGARCGAWIAR